MCEHTLPLHSIASSNKPRKVSHRSSGSNGTLRYGHERLYTRSFFKLAELSVREKIPLNILFYFLVGYS